jgi:Ca2+-binding RTX toxin-like protein/methionine-rich copper-binding protein CopC
MIPTTDDLVYAAKLSNAAYGRDAADNKIHANTALSGTGWTYVDPGVSGIIDRTDAYGYYSFLGFEVLIAKKGDTWAIAFRGTKELIDWFQDAEIGSGGSVTAYDLALKDFVSRILTASLNDGATKVLITGHSQGAALAEHAFVNHGLDQRIVGVTFASPGIEYNGPTHGGDSRLLNLGHKDLDNTAGDLVFNLTPFDRQAGIDIRIELPDELDDVFPVRFGQHDLGKYHYSATQIDRVLSNHNIGATAFKAIVIGTDAANTLLEGNSENNLIIGDGGPEVIYGYGGNDLLDGFSGDDVIYGGAGNDTIDGGSGLNDVAVFNLPLTNYTVAQNGSNLRVISNSADTNDGVDLVTNTIEFLRFGGMQYTFSSLLPPSDASAPALIGTAPADDQSGVSAGALIVLSFDEAVFPGAGTIEIRNGDNSLFQSISINDHSQVSFAGSNVIIDPIANFALGSQYYVMVSNSAVQDQAGNKYAGIVSPNTFNFTTAGDVDSIAPNLVNLAPADNATNVPVGADFVFTFDETVRAGTGTISIFASNGAHVHSASIVDVAQVSFGGNTIVFDPTVNLSPLANYYITISPGAVRDQTGNAFAGLVGPNAYNFSTEAPIYVAPPVVDDIFLSVSDAYVAESNDGIATLTFHVAATGAGAGSRTISVQFETQDTPGATSPATSGVDYIAKTSVLVIPAGETTGQITVTVLGDYGVEPDEVLQLLLSQPSERVQLLNSSGEATATISATGTILNDDSAPNHYPYAAYDQVTTAPNTPVTIYALANDTDAEGDAIHITEVRGGVEGTLLSSAPDGQSIIATPPEGYSGPLSLTYGIMDDSTNPIRTGAPEGGAGGGTIGVINVLVGGDGSAGIYDPGTFASDIIVGGNGNDTLSGGFGDDTIAGGLGVDRIDGGQGFDYADYRQSPGGVTIGFADPFIFNDGYSNSDILTDIEGILGSPHNDYISGVGTGIERLYTGYRLYGNDGNDSLWADAGDDVLDGGAGDDLLIFGAGRDIVFGGFGNDTIYSLYGGDDTEGDLLEGGEGNDEINASGFSPDVLIGEGGNDYLQFGNGDIASGGVGADTFFVSAGLLDPLNPYQASIVDLELGESIRWIPPDVVATSSGSFWFVGPITSGDGQFTEQNRIEHSIVGDKTVLYFGLNDNLGADFVLAIAGVFEISQLEVDTTGWPILLRVQGGSGDDTLVGGENVSSTFTGSGNSYNGDVGNDTIDYASTSQGITVNLSLTSNQATGPEISTDTLISIENVIGGSGDDQIYGDVGPNRLIGGDGTDTLSGGDGADSLSGDSGDDLLLGDSGRDVLSGGSGADDVRGGNDNDTLSGGADNDTIRGGNGKDRLYGDDGDDVLFGHDGNDLLEGRNGNDFLKGDAGNDWLLGGEGNDALQGGTGNDHLRGENGDDVLFGDDGRDTLLGAAGTDEMRGGAGDDSISGGADGDKLFGWGENDLLEGDAGDDFMKGDAGDDTLDGGAGQDSLIGGAGNDVFRFNPDAAIDYVGGFTPGAGPSDQIELVGYGPSFDSFAEVMAAATQVGTRVIIDFGGGDTLHLLNTSLASLSADDFIFG